MDGAAKGKLGGKGGTARGARGRWLKLAAATPSWGQQSAAAAGSKGPPTWPAPRPAHGTPHHHRLRSNSRAAPSGVRHAAGTPPGAYFVQHRPALGRHNCAALQAGIGHLGGGAAWQCAGGCGCGCGCGWMMGQAAPHPAHAPAHARARPLGRPTGVSGHSLALMRMASYSYGLLPTRMMWSHSACERKPCSSRALGFHATTSTLHPTGRRRACSGAGGQGLQRWGGAAPPAAVSRAPGTTSPAVRLVAQRNRSSSYSRRANACSRQAGGPALLKVHSAPSSAVALPTGRVLPAHPAHRRRRHLLPAGAPHTCQQQR